ncbi:hypothetical protein [Paludisphaera soli]|uniref:hypothetical protein n=1 Tax=Paludisphaera soli TaxID=2712865 RepID=UPI0013E9DEE5|nr:hypothetical protein [Paludisphaera soli]
MSSSEEPAPVPEGPGEPPAPAPGPAPGPAGRRSGPLVAMLALAVIAGAGSYVWSQVDWTMFQAPPPPPPESKPRPPGWVDTYGNQADVPSLLTIQAPGANGKATVFLGRAGGPRDPLAVHFSNPRILERELVRQAVLLAARDERGLTTRDELLDGAAPPAGEARPLKITTVFSRSLNRLLARIPDGKRAEGLIEPVLAKALGGDPESDDFPTHLASTLEGMTRAEFPKLLDQHGGRGEPNRIAAEGPAPGGVEERLATLGLVDHFEAVRALHRAIRAEGESPERLGLLARAYAQLAALTAHHWSPVHRAFQARALLYAERLVARDPDSSFALRHRAFARALVGLHAAAMKDLEAAKSLDAKAGRPAPVPGWVEVIDAHLNYDRARLEAAKPPHDRLAALLKMVNFEFPAYTRLAAKSAEAVLQLDPDCGRAFDVLSNNGGLNDKHRATDIAPQAFRALFRTKLADADDLPETVRKALERDADDLALTDALDEAGSASVDPDEPSWGVLAQLAREARFVQVQRRLTFMARNWGVPVEDYWDEVKPLVEGHRFRPYLGAITRDKEEARKFAEFARTFPIVDLELTESDLIEVILGDSKRDPRDLRKSAEVFSSRTARDLSSQIAEGVNSGLVPTAEALLRVSPRNPYAKDILVRHDWERSQPRLEEWKKSDGGAAAFQRGLGYQYLDLKRFAEAREWLARYVEQSPDRTAYEKLAESYEGEGDREGWLAALEAYLENTEDAGLDHAQVRVRIANYYLSQDRPKEAKPYSDEAAQTWAGWAMLCASEVDERLGDLESAEDWARNVSERYPDSWNVWYRFCKRTGEGDLDGATDLARAAVRAGVAPPVGRAYLHWLEGEPDEAIRTLERVYETTPEDGIATLLISLYDQTGAAGKRDDLMRKVIEEVKPTAPTSAALLDLMLKSTAVGAPPLDLAAVQAQLDESPAEIRLPLRFHVGRFLLNHGRPEDARTILEPCLARGFDEWCRAASAAWLREAFPPPKPAEPERPRPRPEDEPTRT